jgi:hypothetical protein
MLRISPGHRRVERRRAIALWQSAVRCYFLRRVVLRPVVVVPLVVEVAMRGQIRFIVEKFLWSTRVRSLITLIITPTKNTNTRTHQYFVSQSMRLPLLY